MHEAPLAARIDEHGRGAGGGRGMRHQIRCIQPFGLELPADHRGPVVLADITEGRRFIPSLAIAMPELETSPPVVTAIGSVRISRPPPIGLSNGTGRTRMSTTQDPHTTQSIVFSIMLLPPGSRATG